MEQKSQLKEIVALANRQVKLEEEVLTLENSLKDMNEQLRVVSEEDLPSAMKEAGLAKFTLEDGQEINIKPDYRVGIPAARREEAFEWLEDKGFGGLIKTVVGASFGKGELERAQKLAADLVKKKFQVAIVRDVHWQTLKAFVSEQTLKLEPVPFDLFGVTPINRAVINAKKERK